MKRRATITVVLLFIALLTGCKPKDTASLLEKNAISNLVVKNCEIKGNADIKLDMKYDLSSMLSGYSEADIKAAGIETIQAVKGTMKEDFSIVTDGKQGKLLMNISSDFDTEDIENEYVSMDGYVLAEDDVANMYIKSDTMDHFLKQECPFIDAQSLSSARLLTINKDILKDAEFVANEDGTYTLIQNHLNEMTDDLKKQILSIFSQMDQSLLGDNVATSDFETSVELMDNSKMEYTFNEQYFLTGIVIEGVHYSLNGTIMGMETDVDMEMSLQMSVDGINTFEEESYKVPEDVKTDAQEVEVN